MNQINSFTIDGNYMYLGTDRGVYRSTDSGKNWTENNNGIKLEFNQSINCVYVAGDKLFMGTHEGIYISENKGDSWKSVTKKEDYKAITRYGQLKRNIFYFVLFLLWGVFWITPMILLNKVKNGYRIYFFNLILGIIFIIGGLATYANQPTNGRWDFGNLGRAVFIMMLYAIWGFAFLLYSIYRKWRYNRDNFS